MENSTAASNGRIRDVNRLLRKSAFHRKKKHPSASLRCTRKETLRTPGALKGMRSMASDMASAEILGEFSELRQRLGLEELS
ncbi:hypothetical protein KSP40_PGU022510 [Platanthera guangdongensis]|uniref:Uncharacterized protein n=1 Tax=Platanthera guangdongensis TaxID=2320717 RepID=A0ABR2MDJ7_9ASPA